MARALRELRPIYHMVSSASECSPTADALRRLARCSGTSRQPHAIRLRAENWRGAVSSVRRGRQSRPGQPLQPNSRFEPNPESEAVAHLDKLAKAAVYMTAERLGLNPVTLADWVKNDQLRPNMMFLLGQRGVHTEHRAEVETALLEYLGFLEHETELNPMRWGEGS